MKLQRVCGPSLSAISGDREETESESWDEEHEGGVMRVAGGVQMQASRQWMTSMESVCTILRSERSIGANTVVHRVWRELVRCERLVVGLAT